MKEKKMSWVKVITPLVIITVFTFVFTACQDDTEDLICPSHIWGGDVVTAPTCADGYTTQTCSVCSETRQINPTAGTGQHDWGGDVITPPSCIGGYTTQTCSICSETQQINPTSAIGQHSWGGDVVTPPSCIRGYTTQTCSVCKETQKINPTTPNGQHNWANSIVVAPTCEEDGYTERVCTRNCNDGEISITVEMWDRNGNGWNESGELIIVVSRIDEYGRGIFIYGDLDNAQIKPKAIGSKSYYYFDVLPDDRIEAWFYYITTTNHSEKAFAIYYSNDPPNPPFNPDPNYWLSENDPYDKVLTYKQYNTIISPRSSFKDIFEEFYIEKDTSIQRYNIVPALEHSFTATIPATCLTDSIPGTCTREGCGETIPVVPALGHDGVWTVIDTTYPATSTGICSRCSVTSRTTEIGDTGPGGGKIIFIADGSQYSFVGFGVAGYGNEGDPGYFAPYVAYYLEAAPTNAVGGTGAQTTMRWSIRNALTGHLNIVGTSHDYGQGRRNTALIIAAERTANPTDTYIYAALACFNYSTATANDWFLPSGWELYELFQQRNLFGIQPATRFWSSNQYDINNATLLNFTNPYTSHSFTTKDSTFQVRPIRAF